MCKNFKIIVIAKIRHNIITIDIITGTSHIMSIPEKIVCGWKALYRGVLYNMNGASFCCKFLNHCIIIKFCLKLNNVE